MVDRKVNEGSDDLITFVNDLTVVPPARISGVQINAISGSSFVGTVTQLSGGTQDSTTYSGTQNFLGQVNFSGVVNVNATIATTATITAAKSGTFAPLNWLQIQVSGNSVKIPYFAV